MTPNKPSQTQQAEFFVLLGLTLLGCGLVTVMDFQITSERKSQSRLLTERGVGLLGSWMKAASVYRLVVKTMVQYVLIAI